MSAALQRVGSQYPLLTLIARGDTKAREKLERGNLTIVEVDPLWRPAQFPQWEYAYTRLRLWELVEYDEIVAMDADIAVIRNPDALAGNLPFVSGTMVLRPSLADFQKLQAALGKEWVGEHELIQHTLPVAASLPPEYDVVATSVLESCGCRPDEASGDYVASLPAVSPYQNIVTFGGEAEYFPGVRDAD